MGGAFPTAKSQEELKSNTPCRSYRRKRGLTSKAHRRCFLHTVLCYCGIYDERVDAGRAEVVAGHEKSIHSRRELTAKFAHIAVQCPLLCWTDD